MEVDVRGTTVLILTHKNTLVSPNINGPLEILLNRFNYDILRQG